MTTEETNESSVLSAITPISKPLRTISCKITRKMMAAGTMTSTRIEWMKSWMTPTGGVKVAKILSSGRGSWSWPIS